MSIATGAEMHEILVFAMGVCPEDNFSKVLADSYDPTLPIIGYDVVVRKQKEDSFEFIEEFEEMSFEQAENTVSILLQKYGDITVEWL